MKNVKGFSLIELMIVVAIIGIIAAYATTSYQASVIKTKRADAKATLMDIAAQFERCYTANGQYTTTTTPPRTCSVVGPAPGYNFNISDDSLKGHYDITLDTATFSATAFKITATPKNPTELGGFVDNDCTSFSLDEKGLRSATGGVGNLGTGCW